MSKTKEIVRVSYEIEERIKDCIDGQWGDWEFENSCDSISEANALVSMIRKHRKRDRQWRILKVTSEVVK